MIIGGVDFDAIGTIDEPPTRADGLKYIGVPETVSGGDPLVKVVPATTIASGEALIEWLATVRVTGSVSPERGTVLVPMMRADESRCIRVPDTVMGGAHGVKVVPAIEMPWESGWTTSLLVVLTWPWLKAWK